MSKIGDQPINVPQGLEVKIEDSQVKVSGPKGELSFRFRPEVKVQLSDNKIKVTRTSDQKYVKALHGLTRSLIANIIKGVNEGHQKTLEIIGVGYKAVKQMEDLILNVGYSHPVLIKQVPGVEIETKENKIIVRGIDKALVGEIAARIRRVRPPEPYKGKGIRYEGEIIKQKAGKAVKTTTGA